METIKVVINCPIKMPVDLKELHDKLSSESKVSSTLAALYIKYLRGEIQLDKNHAVDDNLLEQQNLILANQMEILNLLKSKETVEQPN